MQTIRNPNTSNRSSIKKEEKHANFATVSFHKTDSTDKEESLTLNKNVENLHKEINIFEIFDSFNDIVKISSTNNELNSQFYEKNKEKHIVNNSTLPMLNMIRSMNIINDVSLLYSFTSYPKLYESNRKHKENINNSSINFSQIEENRKNIKRLKVFFKH